MRVYGKEGGRKPDLVLVVEANDLAKLKEKILVGIGTAERTLLYVPHLIDGTQNPPAFVGKMAVVVNLAILDHFLCAISFFIGRTNVS